MILSDKGLDFEELGIKPDQLFSNLASDKYDLEFLMKLGVQKHSEQLKEVAIQAVKENELNNLITIVEDFWKNSKLTLRQFVENQDFYILGDNEDLIQQTDDMFMIVNNIMQSKYVDSVRDKAEKQFTLLKYAQKVLDEWILFQKEWLYLLPILSSSFVQKNLVRETKDFNN